MIDKKPIQDMPNKNFGDKHFASEFNKVKAFLLKAADAINEIPGMIESDFKGILSPSDPAPLEDGTYKPSISSPEPGTDYPNAGNLKSIDGYSTFFYKKGLEWTKSETKLLPPEIFDSGLYVNKPNNELQKHSAIAVKEIIIKNYNHLFDYYLTGFGRNYDDSVNGYQANQYFVRLAIVERSNPDNYRYSTCEFHSIDFNEVPSVLENADFIVTADWGKFPEFERMAVDFSEQYKIYINNISPTVITNYLQLKRTGDRNNYLLGAGNNSDTGQLNLIIGDEAAEDFIDAGDNVGFGFRVFKKKKHGGANTAVGNGALERSEETIDCTAVGAGALSNVKAGIGDTAVGRKSIEASQYAGANTGIGDSSLMSVNYRPADNNIGYGNLGAGYGAGVDGPDWSESVLLGLTAGRKGVGGKGNVLSGAYTIHNRLIASHYNTVSGFNAMYGSMAGDYNTVSGANSLYDASGDYNVVSGYNSAPGMTSMNRSVILGSFAGSSVSATYNVIVIGHGSMASKNNQIVIGNSEHTEIVLCGVTFTKEKLEALLSLV